MEAKWIGCINNYHADNPKFRSTSIHRVIDRYSPIYVNIKNFRGVVQPVNIYQIYSNFAQNILLVNGSEFWVLIMRN